ncbi:MAG: poly-gamma-glutamate hydrolase family protein [Pseudonocardiales bacterium]|nr:poly-gamma-glutamate hydrolase family protein [Pseudonocardiales bacterium]
MFAELLAHPGVVEEVELRSEIGFLAFHGGNLEKGTDDIAREAARRSGSSLYAVMQPASLRWHIPSKLIDPAASPPLASFLDHVDVAIAIHGYGRNGLFTTLLLGGANRVLGAHVGAVIRTGLPQYEIVDDLDAIPTELRGLHPDNPVNRPRHGGVQVELPPRVRGHGPFWADHDPTVRTPHTEALIDALASAAATWPPTGT